MRRLWDEIHPKEEVRQALALRRSHMKSDQYPNSERACGLTLGALKKCKQQETQYCSVFVDSALPTQRQSVGSSVRACAFIVDSISCNARTKYQGPSNAEAGFLNNPVIHIEFHLIIIHTQDEPTCAEYPTIVH